MNKTTLQIGDKAPDFTLVSSEKKPVSLRDYSGQPVVLLFFPMAFTSVCTEELCTMRDRIGEFEEVNAQVLAISVDSPFTLAKFKAEQNFNFPLLSDFNKETSSAYDALYEEFVLGLRGVAKRSAFVIDPHGIIRYAEVLENAGKMPDLEAVKAVLSRINEAADIE